MTDLKVAVVGCGGMGTIHARNVTALGLGEVVTFADAVPERAAALQAEVGTGAVSTDIRRAIEDPHIQAVVIATHHDSHPDYAVMAANAGKHILIEKPLALTVTAAQRIFEAVVANDVQLMVGFQARFAPLVTRAKAFIPQSLVSTGQMIDPRWGDALWAQSPDRGGANVLSQGVHTFDLLSYFHDSEPVAIAAGGGAFTHPDSALIDSTVCTIYYANGSTASAVIGDFGPAHHVKKSFYQLFDGEGKSATIYGYFAGLTLGDGKETRESTTVEQLSPEEQADYTGYRALMREFASSVGEGRPIRTGATAQDGLLATALAIGAFTSIRERRIVDLADLG